MHDHKSDDTNIKQQNKPSREKYNNKPFGDKRKKRAPRKITPTYLHNSGLYYLERFAASKKHFITVMSRKARRSCMHHKDQDYDECVKMVHDVADKFEKIQLLNDDLYTEGVVNSLRRRGLSTNAIVNKMRMKGIEPDKTRAALNKRDDAHHDTQNDAEIYAALKHAKKKRVGPFFTGEEENMKRSLGMFARAGFSYDISKKILDMNSEEAEDLFYNARYM